MNDLRVPKKVPEMVVEGVLPVTDAAVKTIASKSPAFLKQHKEKLTR